jgi:NAD(P)-dependent dehydrogenase (short-subunit alcohol dehydrogenase family)
MSSYVWFITGASRGFGLEIARAALERGHSVVAAARNPEAVGRALGFRDNLLAVELDVSMERQAQAGDPVKAAAAILEIATAQDPPLRLQLGADCVARVEAKTEAGGFRVGAMAGIGHVHGL